MQPSVFDKIIENLTKIVRNHAEKHLTRTLQHKFYYIGYKLCYIINQKTVSQRA